jgi:hypothetical protein
MLTRWKDVSHPVGPGRLVHVGCTVQFHIIIPVDLQRLPYFLFTSIGVHTHPPSPPVTPPAQIANEILGLIKRMQDPGLTVCKLLKTRSQSVNNILARFLRSPFIEEFCQQHQSASFESVHASLSNMDRLRRWIYRERLIMYPQGQDLAGVEFEWKMRHQNPETVQILFQTRSQRSN